MSGKSDIRHRVYMDFYDSTSVVDMLAIFYVSREGKFDGQIPVGHGVEGFYRSFYRTPSLDEGFHRLAHKEFPVSGGGLLLHLGEFGEPFFCNMLWWR